VGERLSREIEEVFCRVELPAETNPEGCELNPFVKAGTPLRQRLQSGEFRHSPPDFDY